MSPTSATLPCPILPVLRPAAAAALRRLHENDRLEADPGRIQRRNARHSALVSENADQVSNEATLATTSARQIARQGHQAAFSSAVLLNDAQPLDDGMRPVRGVLAAFQLPAGPEMARSSLPAIVNLPAADGAVSPVRAAAPAQDPRSGLTR